jgi:VWFA-related protein
MNIRNSILLAAGLALCAGVASNGAPQNAAPQNPAPQTAAQPSATQQNAPPAKPAPAIRAVTRLIQVSVLVHDKHGEPVTGLTKDDFTVLDERQTQTIRLFSVETNLPTEHPAAPLPPDTYTNRVTERGGTPKNVTIVLLDGLNTEFTDQVYARKEAIKFLEQIQPNDRVGIYTLGDKLAVLHDFTTDSAALLGALKNYGGRISSELTASTPEEQPINSPTLTGQSDALTAALDAFMQAPAQREANFYTTNRVLLTVEAFEVIARHVAAIPGRKNLVWISGSFPINFGFDDVTQANMTPLDQQLQFEEQIEKAARAVNDANLAIYPVDARGLMPSNMNIAKSNMGRSGLQGRPKMIQAPRQSEFATMTVLADRTGGRAFYNTNDLFKAIRTAVDDSRVTYELGYYPTNPLWDGKFHEIKVMVNRPGVNVRARKGYFAVAEPRTTPADEKAALSAAATSPLESTTLGLTVDVAAVNVPGAEAMKTVLHFDPREIPFRQAEGHWKGRVETVYVLLDEKGKILNAPAETIDLVFTPERYEQVQKAGLSKTKIVPMVAGAIELRVLLVDKTSGSIGAVSIPLKAYFPQTASQN